MTCKGCIHRHVCIFSDAFGVNPLEKCKNKISIEELKNRWNAVIPKMIKFTLNGCDISFTAEAPKDITLEKLLKQCDKIEPDWCACGICSAKPKDKVEISIGYNSIEKVDKDAPCNIKGEEEQ